MKIRPLLSSAAAELMHDVEVMDERGRLKTIAIPAERPLTMYVDKRELVTLMTLGGAPEALTLGRGADRTACRATHRPPRHRPTAAWSGSPAPAPGRTAPLFFDEK